MSHAHTNKSICRYLYCLYVNVFAPLSAFQAKLHATMKADIFSVNAR